MWWRSTWWISSAALRGADRCAGWPQSTPRTGGCRPNSPTISSSLYGFGGVPDDLDAALAEVRSRAQRCPDLSVQVRDDCRLTYPAWVPRRVGDDQFARYRRRTGLERMPGRSLPAWPVISSTPPAHPGRYTCSPGSVTFPEPPPAPSSSCRCPTPLPTAPGPRHWPPGCWVGPATSCRCRLRGFRPCGCHGVRCGPPAPTGSWCATPLLERSLRRRRRGLCCTATPRRAGSAGAHHRPAPRSDTRSDGDCRGTGGHLLGAGRASARAR